MAFRSRDGIGSGRLPAGSEPAFGARGSAAAPSLPQQLRRFCAFAAEARHVVAEKTQDVKIGREFGLKKRLGMGEESDNLDDRCAAGVLESAAWDGHARLTFNRNSSDTHV